MSREESTLLGPHAPEGIGIKFGPARDSIQPQPAIKRSLRLFNQHLEAVVVIHDVQRFQGIVSGIRAGQLEQRIMEGAGDILYGPLQLIDQLSVFGSNRHLLEG